MSATGLESAYLIAGSDRPKVRRALGRLRARFPEEAVDVLTAEEADGRTVAAACNALGLFGVEGGRLVIVQGVDRWRKDDAAAVAAYLGDPAPGSVLALVAEETRVERGLVEACEKAGQVLTFDVPKPKDPSVWVRRELERLGVPADAEAARALVEIAGDDTTTLATEIEKMAAWSRGEPVRRADVERLVVAAQETTAWALTDAWGARDVRALLRACEAELGERESFVVAARLAAHVSLVRTVQSLVAEGVGVRDVAKHVRVHEFRARKAARHAENYSRDELDQAIVRLAALDASLKGASPLASELQLERALVEVAGAGAPA